jgi:hypothetical protein
MNYSNIFHMIFFEEIINPKTENAIACSCTKSGVGHCMGGGRYEYLGGATFQNKI